MHMSDAALRAAVEKRRKQLKRPDEGRVLPETWSLLDQYGWIEDALTRDSGEEAINLLVERIDYAVAAFTEVAPGSGGRRMRRGEGYDDAEHYGESSEAAEQALAVDLSDYEYERSRAYVEVMARLLDQAEEVIEFRRNYLNGEVLT